MMSSTAISSLRYRRGDPPMAYERRQMDVLTCDGNLRSLYTKACIDPLRSTPVTGNERSGMDPAVRKTSTEFARTAPPCGAAGGSALPAMTLSAAETTLCVSVSIRYTCRGFAV